MSNILSLCEVEECDFEVIALHTVLPDYKLAFLLNTKLGFNFNRVIPDLDYKIDGKEAFFSAFEYQDTKCLINWCLIGNKFIINATEGNSLGLFRSEATFASTCVYLQPEIKQVDFILKIGGDVLDKTKKEILQEINKIEGVITAYLVDSKKLKHKEYLIF